MAFKMKNASMAKLTKAAGDNRTAMKMKMEDKAAAKMKKESAMKKDERSYFQRLKDEGKQIGKGVLGASAALNEPMGDGIPNDPIKGFKEAYKEEEDKQASKRKGSTKKKSATKMKKGEAMKMKDKSAMKEGPKSTKSKKIKGGAKKMSPAEIARLNKSLPKFKKPSPAKQKMNMVKGPDGKMVPDFAVDGKGSNDMKSGVKMVKAVRKKQTEKKIKNIQQPKIKNTKAKPVKQTTKKPKESSVKAKF